MTSRFVSAAAFASILSLGLAGLATPSLAQPDLYIAQYKFQDADVRAMRLDGSDERLLFTMPSNRWLPIGLSYSTQTGKLVWMDSAGTSAVFRASLDGSGLTQSPAVPGFCKGASLDGQGRVYFGSDNRVMRINADGSGVVTLYTSPTTPFPVGAPKVDATNGHVYFGDDGFIRRMNLDGSNVKVIVSGISQARNIALDIASGFIYWCDADTISDYIGRAKLDGTEFTVLVDNSPSVVQSSGLLDLIVAPALDTIVFADDIADRVNTTRLDGTDNTIIFSAVLDQSPSGIALSTGEPAQALLDMNGNGVQDDADIAAGAPDCDNNGIIDTFQTDPCPQRTFLLDQGSRADLSSGKAIGELSVWEIFQLFQVPAGGWDVGEVGLDGFTVNYHDGSGFTARFLADDGTGQFPDESQVFASVAGNFRFNTNYENWVYLPVATRLEAGLYWLHVKSTAPTTYPNTYHGVANLGVSGLGSKSRGSSGNFTIFGSPMAMRIVEGVPELCGDFNGDQFVDFFDYDAFVTCFETLACPPGRSADYNGDQFVDFFDYDDFVSVFENGC
ncbi:MAG: hypothetical protein HEQ23_01130 [Tepidisphaera sp.]